VSDPEPPCGIRTFRAGTEDAGDRLDVALARWLGEPRNQASSRIDRGEVTVDGRPARRSRRLERGDLIEVGSPPPEPSGAAGVPPPPVRYEDEHLVVVAKPPGLVVHPGSGHPAGTMVQALAAAGVPLAPAGGPERPGIVHRLDRDTSGLLVVAKTDAAYHGLVAALKERSVTRLYATLVEGTLPSPNGRIEGPIGRHPADRRRFAVVQDGKPAATTWALISAGQVRAGGGLAVSYLRCGLESGRTHQIRVHLSSAGHPVVGDETYGARRDVAQELQLVRPFLHAQHLAFRHPVTGHAVRVDEPLPEDLRAALAGTGTAPDGDLRRGAATPGAAEDAGRLHPPTTGRG
jgi:23S rRNA pseudouridine1911/1915/1917 synthase